MSLFTLAEGQTRARDVLDEAIIETIISDGEILPYLPLMGHTGDAYTYMRESTLPTVGWKDPGGTWTHDESTVSTVTVRLKMVGGDIELDEYIRRTLSNPTDIKAYELKQKVKAMMRTINNDLIYGDEDNNASEPDGLHDFLQSNTGQRVERGSGGSPQVARIQDLDNMLRLIKGGDPNVILMDKPTRDSLKRYWDSLGSSYAMIEAFGRKVLAYNGIPILGTDYVSSTEAVSGTSFSTKTGGTATSIFTVRFGEDAMHGLVLEGMTLPEIEDIGPVANKDAKGTRVKWYINPCIYKSTLAIAGITGCTSGGTWTA